MGIRFVPDPTFADQLGNDQKFRGQLLARGIDVRKEIANHTPSGKTGGRRVRGFIRKSFAELDGQGRDVAVQVGTKWRLGHIIEFGSIHNAPYAPVRKAAQALGHRLVGGGR